MNYKRILMKKYLTIITFIGLLATGLSCSEEFLDRPPFEEINNDVYWKTATDLANYTLQFYPAFPAYNNLGSASYLGLLGWDGMRGSDTQISSSPSTVWDGTRAPVTQVTSDGNWVWENIQNVNTFFGNYARCADPFDQYKHYLGEAHFFKAWFYFEKVRLYGDVPWFTNSLAMDSEALYKARDPRAVVVDSILAHLDKAVEYLSLLQDAPGRNNRLSKQAALLFKSRVALFEGTWQKYHRGTPFATTGAEPEKYFRQAVAAAEELMQPAYGLSLYTNNAPESDYCRLFSLKDQSSNSEVLLWKAYSVSLNLSHSFQIYVSDRTAGISITMEQVHHYLDRDGKPYDYFTIGRATKGNAFLSRIKAACDPRLAQTIWTPGAVMWDNGFGRGVFTKPFLDKSGEMLNNTGFQVRKGNDPAAPLAGGGAQWSQSDETGAIVFRYAEALLNYAEAKAELGEPVDYGKSINLLRRRSGMPDFVVQSDPNRSRYADYGYPVSDELHEIRRERAVELGAEGFRYDDIRRWAAHALLKGKRPKGYPFDPAEWTGQNINYKTDANGFLDPFVGQIPNGYGFNVDRDYLESVPTNEITLNPELTQNPGW